MKKELSPQYEAVACEVCQRTILRGERTEPFLVPDGSRRIVCELCVRRAEGAGWLRESADMDMPTAFPRSEPRRSILGRLRARWTQNGPAGAPNGTEAHEEERPRPHRTRAARSLPEPQAGARRGPERVRGGGGTGGRENGGRGAGRQEDSEDEQGRYDGQGRYDPEAPAPEEELAGAASDEEILDDEPELRDRHVERPKPPVEERPRRERGSRRGLRDPRHVRAVPTNAEARVERGLELFNASEYRRTVAGLARTLGDPWVTALPVLESRSEITVVVAWELSWYQYRVDLADVVEPVTLARQGREVSELEEDVRRWNAATLADGSVVLDTPAP